MKYGKILRGALPVAVAAVLAGCTSYAPEREIEMKPGGSASEYAPQACGAPVLADMAVEKAAPARNFAVSKDRKMAYQTSLLLHCQDVPKALRSAAEIARKYKGYVAESENFRIRIKIPVESADAALNELEALGKVTDRKIRAQDVTEQYVDTQVRIGNLRKLHGKLTDLLSRAKNVDEILKVERELARITTELERYETKMKNLALRVALVDMTIRFEAVVQETMQSAIVPIPWIGELGTEISRREFSINQNDDVPFKVTLPAGFAVLYSDKYTLYAVNPDDVVLKLSLRSNFRDATMDFYRAMIERALFTQNGYRKTALKRVNTGRREFVTVSGERQLGQSAVRYFAALTIHDRGWLFKDEAVALLELWGKPEAVQSVDVNALLKSVRF